MPKKSETQDAIFVSLIMVVVGFIYAALARPTVQKLASGGKA